MDMSFVGISGEITVFERMSVDILVQDEMFASVMGEYVFLK